MMQNKIISWLFIAAIISILFFLSLYFAAFYKFPIPQPAQVVLELITIPMMVAQFVFVIFSFMQWRAIHFRMYSLPAILMFVFVAIIILTIGSIVLAIINS